MAKNIYRFRKLKWGDPQRPWLKRGSPLPDGQGAGPSRRSPLDSPWMIVGGFVLAFGLGWLVFGG